MGLKLNHVCKSVAQYYCDKEGTWTRFWTHKRHTHPRAPVLRFTSRTFEINHHELQRKHLLHFLIRLFESESMMSLYLKIVDLIVHLAHFLDQLILPEGDVIHAVAWRRRMEDLNKRCSVIVEEFGWSLWWTDLQSWTGGRGTVSGVWNMTSNWLA